MALARCQRAKSRSEVEDVSEEPYEVLLVEVEAGVALITLNRPEQLNAFTPGWGSSSGTRS